MRTNFLMSCCALVLTFTGVTATFAQKEAAILADGPARRSNPFDAPVQRFDIFDAPSALYSVPTLSRASYPGFTNDPAAVKAMNESNQKIAIAIKGIKESESDGDKATFKKEIQAELESQYDTYLTQHEKPLLQLEERLAKLREEFESRKQAKDDLVKLRLDTIWYNALGIGWPSRSNVRGLSPFATPPSNFPAPNGTFAPVPPPYAPRPSVTVPTRNLVPMATPAFLNQVPVSKPATPLPPNVQESHGGR